MAVHTVFRDYPACVVADLIDRLSAWVGPGRVARIHVERNLRAVERAPDGPEDLIPRLVVVTAPRLVDRTAWILASYPRPRTPAMLALHGVPGSLDLPGPTLVLHGASSQSRLVADWLRHHTTGDTPLVADMMPMVAFDAVARLFSGGDTQPSAKPLSPIHERVLKGLLAGEAVLRTAAAGGPITVERQDYRSIYDHLRLAATQAADAAIEPLSAAMVARANAYLLHGAAASVTPTTRPDGKADPVPRQITRRELTDLGNVRGETLRGLVAWLHELGESGLAEFKTLGTNRPLRKEDPWPSGDREVLAAILLPWTAKQVRTHFGRLHSEGLITGTRAGDNQPWVYQLPEALETADSPFRSLPKPDEIEDRAAPAGPSVGANRNPNAVVSSEKNAAAGPQAHHQGDPHAEAE
jgi:hypothetical protein